MGDRLRRIIHRAARTGLAGLAGLAGLLLTACSGVPDRSTEADALTAALRALPAVESVDGRYARNQSAGYSYNVDIRLRTDATADQARTVAERYHAGLVAADFSRHTSRFALHLGDDVIRVFGNDRHRYSPSPEVARWFEVVGAVPGAIVWAIGPDPTADLGSISLELDRPGRDGAPAQLTGLPALLGARAADLADRQWIVRWRKLRLDLMGPQYPDAATIALIGDLAGDGQWSAIFEPTANPTLRLAVWAAAPDAMEATAREHLPRIARLGRPVSYTVRANNTPPVEVLVGGCLAGGSDLQQRLNREFGTC